jgi:hypothetical protein
MSSVIISGDTSGAITVSAPAVSGTNTLTLQAATATNAVNKLETALAYNWNGLTTNTSLDFTGIPSWCKKITVMFSGVSGSGTSNFLLQIGDAGGIENTGYSGGSFNAGATANSTAGFDLTAQNLAAQVWGGSITLTNLSGNIWCQSGVISGQSGGYIGASGGAKELSATLDRVRITTVNGIDTFDAGTINLLLEG